MERLDDNHLNIFTDGSMKEKPRRGGFGFRFVWTGSDGCENVFDSAANGIRGANSQEMELTAVVEALKLAEGRSCPVDLERFTRVVIWTDSTYVHKHFETAKHRWSNTRWTRSGGAPVLHAELWRELVRVLKRMPAPVEAKWVRGKSSSHTKAVDAPR